MANRGEQDSEHGLTPDREAPDEQGTGTDTGSDSDAAGAGLVDEYSEHLEDEPHEHVKKRPLYKRPAFLISATIVVLVVAVFGIRYWLYARAHESTDGAFVDGHIVEVSPKGGGDVAKIYGVDNQNVNAGDLLLELDPRDVDTNPA